MLFLGPVLAQLVTLSLGDRSEGRYVVSDDTHYEATTRPLAALGFGFRHLTLTVGYTPSITVIPLETKSRDVLVFHSAYLASTYTWGRTSFTVAENAGIGEQNFRTLTLADPRLSGPIGATAPTGVPPGATPTGTPAGQMASGAAQVPNQVRAYNDSVFYATTTTTVGLTHRASTNLSYYEEAGYIASGAARDRDRARYPLIKGPRFLTSLRYRLDRADELAATATAQYAAASNGTSVWIGTTTETWAHKLSVNTITQLGAGVGFTRTPLDLGFVMYSIYPVVTASISDTSRLGRGTLGVSLSVSSSPVVDATTGAADPRLALYATVSWRRDRFSALLSGDSALSLAQSSDRGSLNAAGGGAVVSYGLGKAFSVDTGVRVAYQSYQGQVSVPLSYAAFVGFTFGLQQRL